MRGYLELFSSFTTPFSKGIEYLIASNPLGVIHGCIPPAIQNIHFCALMRTDENLQSRNGACWGGVTSANRQWTIVS